MLNQLLKKVSPCRSHAAFAAVYGSELALTVTGEPSITAADDCGFVFTSYNRLTDTGRMEYWVVKLNYKGNVEWQKAFGGIDNEWPSSIYSTDDGGYIVSGKSRSLGSVGGIEEDFWLLKLSSEGEVEWEKVYEGLGNECPFSCVQTADGGYIAAGRTTSFGAGSTEIWVVKLDASGGISWEKMYGGNQTDQADSIIQTADGGYILCARTDSFGAGNKDILVIKLQADGSVSWSKAYGGAQDDTPDSIIQTSDGGYLFTGTTASFGAHTEDVWVVKIDKNGGIVWQKTYGGAGSDRFLNASVDQSVQATDDGGYIVAAITDSFGSNTDYWLLKLDVSGNILWQKAYDRSATYDAASSVYATSGGYTVIGSSGDTDATGHIMVLNTDLNGDIPGSTVHITDTNATVFNTVVGGQDAALNVTDTSATVTVSHCAVTTTTTSADFF